ncbi:MAG: dATP/dGTP pyrophosphohydrolase domain-containing protein [Pseudomonadota bacterium]
MTPRAWITTMAGRLREALSPDLRELRQELWHARQAILAGGIREGELRARAEKADAELARVTTPAFDLIAHLRRHIAFSTATFGPGARAAGVIDHIRKELREIEADPTDLEEWCDVMMLAFDGAWRSGATPEQIAAAIEAKQTKNEGRQWPDWRTAPTDRAIEHVRIPLPEPQDLP